MPKILLVEDDNNLREIFQMRLQAEGYTTIAAADGEEGLVVSMKEKPDLVIADVMMPKLSGFEMVENLRSAPEMKDTKIIMMTALGQAEDQARGEKLGVVKYLVKSQVTLEDFARVVKEVLGPGSPQEAAAAPAAPTSTNSQESESSMQDNSTTPTPTPSDMPASEPAMPSGDTSAMPSSDAGASVPSADTAQQSTDEQTAVVQDQISSFTSSTTDTSAAPAGDMAAPAAPSEPSAPADTGAPAMPPASEPPAAPTEPPATSEPTDPTSNAL